MGDCWLLRGQRRRGCRRQARNYRSFPLRGCCAASGWSGSHWLAHQWLSLPKNTPFYFRHYSLPEEHFCHRTDELIEFNSYIILNWKSGKIRPLSLANAKYHGHFLFAVETVQTCTFKPCCYRDCCRKFATMFKNEHFMQKMANFGMVEFLGTKNLEVIASWKYVS